mmetsp:Transcript_133192/g.385366  ORF Transcript_133192/g.385366 Transcript_133192/m.385366 type:complete len:224 (-) Transcript_133192:134-805(-)
MQSSGAAGEVDARSLQVRKCRVQLYGEAIDPLAKRGDPQVPRDEVLRGTLRVAEGAEREHVPLHLHVVLMQLLPPHRAVQENAPHRWHDALVLVQGQGDDPRPIPHHLLQHSLLRADEKPDPSVLLGDLLEQLQVQAGGAQDVAMVLFNALTQCGSPVEQSDKPRLAVEASKVLVLEQAEVGLVLSDVFHLQVVCYQLPELVDAQLRLVATRSLRPRTHGGSH